MRLFTTLSAARNETKLRETRPRIQEPIRIIVIMRRYDLRDGTWYPQCRCSLLVPDAWLGRGTVAPHFSETKAKAKAIPTLTTELEDCE